MSNSNDFGHQWIAQRLKADYYLAHPYASWERGTKENTNGLIRQYFPKNRDFTTIAQQGIDIRYFSSQVLHFKFEPDESLDLF